MLQRGETFRCFDPLRPEFSGYVFTDSRFISNHPIKFSKRITNGDFFFFFLFSQSSHACVSASTRGYGAYTGPRGVTGPIFVGCLESEDRRPMTPSKTKTLENEILSVRQKIDGTTLRSVTYCGNNLFRHSILCLYASKPLCSITSVDVRGKS